MRPANFLRKIATKLPFQLSYYLLLMVLVTFSFVFFKNIKDSHTQYIRKKIEGCREKQIRKGLYFFFYEMLTHTEMTRL